MNLTDAECRTAKKAERIYYLSAGDGLRLLVHPNGSKYWSVRYYMNGKEQSTRVGQYPNVGLKAAKLKRNAVQKDVAEGYAPKRKPRKTVPIPGSDGAIEAAPKPGSFRAIAEEWLGKNTWNKDTEAQVTARLKKYVVDHLGPLPIGEITVKQVVAVLVNAEDKGPTRDKVRSYLGQIFRYALVHHDELIKMNPVTEIPLSELKKRKKVVHRKPLPFDQLPKFLHDVDHWRNDKNPNGGDGGFGLHPLVRFAIKLQILTMVRPGEVRHAVWSEFDFDNRLWLVPAERMKSDREHVVPLSDQAMELLAELRKMTGGCRRLFPKIVTKWGGEAFDDSKTFSENTVSQGIKRIGYGCQPHGFRSMASTYLHDAEDEDQRPLFKSAWVEFALAHEDPNPTRRAYNHGRYLTQRTRMLQHWADQVMPRFEFLRHLTAER